MTHTDNPIVLHMAFDRLEFETGFDVRAVIAERDRLREGLMYLYRAEPAAVALVCDTVIDRSGRLLGEIRVQSRA